MTEKTPNKRQMLEKTQEDLFKALRIRRDLMSDSELFDINEMIANIVDIVQDFQDS